MANIALGYIYLKNKSFSVENRWNLFESMHYIDRESNEFSDSGVRLDSYIRLTSKMNYKLSNVLLPTDHTDELFSQDRDRSTTEI